MKKAKHDGAVFDVENLQVEHEGAIYPLAGCSSEVFSGLALRGLWSVIRNRKDRRSAYEHVMGGRLDGRARRPALKVVEALAEANEWPIEQAEAFWLSLSKAGKAEILRHSVIRAFMAGFEEDDPIESVVDRLAGTTEIPASDDSPPEEDGSDLSSGRQRRAAS